jgi:hypothetical protein
MVASLDRPVVVVVVVVLVLVVEDDRENVWQWAVLVGCY